MREKPTMTGAGSFLLTSLVLSFLLPSVCWGHADNAQQHQHLRTLVNAKKMKKFMSMNFMGYSSYRAMKYRPPSMAGGGYMNLFKMPMKGKNASHKMASNKMEPSLWMYNKGKGTSNTKGGIPSKGKGKGTAKGKGDMKSKGMSMKKSKSGRYYPPHQPFPPECYRVCSSACMKVSDIYLVDSTNNVRLFPIQLGEFLDFDFLESFYGVTEFSVECVARGNVGSMLMTNNFGTQAIDNVPPFILAGDDMGDFFDSNFRANPGTWTVTCQPFCEDNAMGPTGPVESISFVVGPGSGGPGPSPTPGCSTCGPGCISVVDYVLVDAQTNTRIRSIVPGETIEVGPDDQYAVECITDPAPFSADPFPVGSTVLTDNYENIEPNLENNPPYSLVDDDSGNFNPSGFFQNPGPWEVSCTAYCGPGATGYASPTNTIGFTVEAVISATPRPPSPVPPTPTPPTPTPPSPVPPTPPAPTPPSPVPPTPPAPTPVPPTPPAPTPPAPTPPAPTPPAPTPPAPTPPVPTPPVPTPPSPVPPTSTSSPVLDCSTCRSGCIFASFFNLVNAETDTVIRPLVEGETLQVSPTDSFAIECITDPAPFTATPFPIGSTFLTDNYEEPGNSENSPPYSLADDNNGDYRPSPLYQYEGEWIVTCQAFCERNQRGDSSNLLTLTFNVERVP